MEPAIQTVSYQAGSGFGVIPAMLTCGVTRCDGCLIIEPRYSQISEIVPGVRGFGDERVDDVNRFAHAALRVVLTGENQKRSGVRALDSADFNRVFLLWKNCYYKLSSENSAREITSPWATGRFIPPAVEVRPIAAPPALPPPPASQEMQIEGSSDEPPPPPPPIPSPPPVAPTEPESPKPLLAAPARLIPTWEWIWDKFFACNNCENEVWILKGVVWAVSVLSLGAVPLAIWAFSQLYDYVLVNETAR